MSIGSRFVAEFLKYRRHGAEASDYEVRARSNPQGKCVEHTRFPESDVVILELCRASHGPTESTGTFPSVASARTKRNEVSSAAPGHYVIFDIFDQTTGKEVFAESTLSKISPPT
jgi:hypothetical protein